MHESWWCHYRCWTFCQSSHGMDFNLDCRVCDVIIRDRIWRFKPFFFNEGTLLLVIDLHESWVLLPEYAIFIAPFFAFFVVCTFFTFYAPLKPFSNLFHLFRTFSGLFVENFIFKLNFLTDFPKTQAFFYFFFYFGQKISKLQIFLFLKPSHFFKSTLPTYFLTHSCSSIIKTKEIYINWNTTLYIFETELKCKQHQFNNNILWLDETCSLYWPNSES